MRKVGTILTVAAVTLVMAATALAGGGPSQTGYGGGGNVLGGVQGGNAPSGGTLPFTGIDLALLVGGGALLAAVGAGLVRAGTRS